MARHPLLSKWLWFAGLWIASVTTLTVVTFAIHLVI